MVTTRSHLASLQYIRIYDNHMSKICVSDDILSVVKENGQLWLHMTKYCMDFI